MTEIELSETTVRNLVRASQQEVEHIRELAADDDCPGRVAERLERNASAIEGSITTARRELGEIEEAVNVEQSNE